MGSHKSFFVNDSKRVVQAAEKSVAGTVRVAAKGK
jgi:hypothetical protein